MRWLPYCTLAGAIAGAGGGVAVNGDQIDLTRAVVVVRSGQRSPAETMAATILVEELARRTQIRLPIRDTWPEDAQIVIAISTRNARPDWSARVPVRKGDDLPETRPEGYAIRVVTDPDGPTRAAVFVTGADGRGAMYGVGRLLRELSWARGAIRLDASFEAATSPVYPIRGHQLGFRPRANAYDAWTPEQYDQYIRELVIFGANCIENIPFEDSPKSKVMRVSRDEMNVRLGEICARYDVDHWIWTPAEFSLKDQARRKAELARHEVFYKSCPRLDAVFFPGGDPGNNPPELVMPFLKDIAALLAKHHPKAGVWISLQGFDGKKVDAFYAYLDQHKPAWLAGVVAGPSSPPIPDTRVRLPERYRLRWYPDITHTVLCQFEMHCWDPAFAMTLGREPVNPRPQAYARIFRFWASHTDGFLTYSDGINDDVNKAVWSQLGWDPDCDVREVLIEYARFFFSPDVAESAADAMLGLENNWKGDLSLNGSVYGVLTMWQELERRHPELLADWRFQVHLMRAYYDAYTRARLLHEAELERQAMAALARADQVGADRAMDEALAILRRATSNPCRPEWRARIAELAEAAFKSIGYQTSVERYGASGYERGAVMDFVDRPLNDRWWLEDEFAKIRKLSSPAEKLARLEVIRTWEDPGPGSFYDDVGHVGKSPHVVQGEGESTDPEQFRHDSFSHSWWDNGRSHRRLSWHHHMRWPAGLAYEAVDPAASYIIRLTGNGEPCLRANGVRLEPTRTSRKIGEFKEYPVPKALLTSGKLTLTFDPIDESHLNWRQHSHVAEVWLLRR